MGIEANAWTEARLDAAIRDNMIGFVQTLSECNDNLQIVEGDHLTYMMSSVSSPIFNRIMSTNEDAARLPDCIDWVNAIYSEHRLPFMWMTWPGDKPENLREKLVTKGFQQIGNMPGMSRMLYDLPDPTEEVKKSVVTSVRSEIAFGMFLDVLTAGFELPADVRALFEQTLKSVGLSRKAPLQHYIAWLDGQPQATASVFYQDGVAGIYNVCTLHPSRGKGLGKAIMMRLMTDARNRGCDAAILHSTDMGFPLYHRLGFREHFRIGMYMQTSK